jgi:hypothetical protein
VIAQEANHDSTRSEIHHDMSMKHILPRLARLIQSDAITLTHRR